MLLKTYTYCSGAPNYISNVGLTKHNDTIGIASNQA